ncbi:MAG: hypothetical protein IJ187_08010 [Neisseriaceae bacterium]|nr:hypothetical protein [Neisseriaceae bacterium]MBR3425357.1 hypothetical protein [Neisseriaceae bacterium]
MISEQVFEEMYRENLEENIIQYLHEHYQFSVKDALNIYYNSPLAEKIYTGRYGVQYLDYKVLAEIIMKKNR